MLASQGRQALDREGDARELRSNDVRATLVSPRLVCMVAMKCPGLTSQASEGRRSATSKASPSLTPASFEQHDHHQR